jgi:hypothetical protein
MGKKGVGMVFEIFLGDYYPMKNMGCVFQA